MNFINCIHKVIHNGITKRLVCPLIRNSGTESTGSMWVPDYLEKAKSEYPEYPVMNIQLKGFDYPILENFQSKIHRLAKNMNIYVSDAWAQELKKFNVVRFKKNSVLPESEYVMKIYERNVQVSDVYSFQLPLLLDIIMTICPPGVTVNVHVHETHHFEDRFVPENRILELKEQLEELENRK